MSNSNMGFSPVLNMDVSKRFCIHSKHHFVTHRSPQNAMPFSLAVVIFFVSSLFALIYFLYQLIFKIPAYRLPPGPRPLPVIGNLHLLSSHPHHDIAKLSKIYGPILHLRLGSIHAIFISSPYLAEKVLKTHDAVFANRPNSFASTFLSYEQKGVAFTDHGPYWRGARKLSVAHFFSLRKIESWDSIRREEVARFVDGLKEAATNKALVNISIELREMAADMVSRAVIGKRCMTETIDGHKVIEYIDDIMRILGSFDLNDFLPYLKTFDLGGIRKRAAFVKEKLDSFLEKIIDEHINSREERYIRNDFVDIMLDYMDDKDAELKIDPSGIKAIVLDIFEGTMDTAPVAVEWTLIELLKHPDSMNKLREELKLVVGMHNVVDEKDLPKLPYLFMVVKESLRLHHLGPFLLHRTKQDFVLEGYDIPKESSVLVCSWAMGRDPDLWADSEKFIPERFENSSIDVKGQHFNLLPFGGGRRGCPALNYSMLVVPLVLAQMVHFFDWKLPDGMLPSDIDMTEKFGLTMPRAVSLLATPTYRLVDV